MRENILPPSEYKFDIRAYVKRGLRTILALAEVGGLSLPALQLAVTAYAEKVHNVTISPFGVLPGQTTTEIFAVTSILALGAPIVDAVAIGKRWGIFKSNTPQA